MVEYEVIQKSIDAFGMTGVAAILLYFVLKRLPDFLAAIQKLGDRNAEQITRAITSQTERTADFNERLARAIEQNTHAVNSLRESRRDDMQKMDEILDRVKGTYRMVESMQRTKQKVANDG